MSTLKLSVILCTHNPNTEYLERTLNALKTQTLDKAQWEFLLVDNASTTDFKNNLDLSWHTNPKIISEPQAGLIYARRCGYQNMQAQLAVFVDDDTLLDSHYLETALSISNTHPNLGTWGGQCIPEFEQAPAAELKPYLQHIAIREFDTDKWANFINYDTLPFGAGFCFRKEVLDFYDAGLQDPLRLNLGAKGNELLRGEDSDMAFTACDMGKGMGLFHQLKLTHIIPANRLEPAYLIKIIEETACSNLIVRYLHKCSITPPSSQLKLQLRILKTKLKYSGFTGQAHLAHIRGEQKAHALLCQVRQHRS